MHHGITSANVLLYAVNREPLGTGGNLVSDAHLAAIAIEQRCVVVSFHHDFGRFAGVNWQPPSG